MPVTYVDFRTAPVDGAEYISEFTWIDEINGEVSEHHYFVDYPGAKDLERQVIEVLGGKPFTRYSCSTVLRTFISNVPKSNIIACRTIQQKQLITSLLKALNITTLKAFCTFDDIDAGDGELSYIMDLIVSARAEASTKFGNAL